MLQAKKPLLFLKLFWGIFAAITLILFAIRLIKVFNGNENSIFMYIFLWFFLCTLIGFFYSLLMSCKKYEYDGHEIIVYAGFIKRYVMIDGDVKDEYSTWINYAPINLTCTLNDGSSVNVRISTTCRITLKVNGNLIKDIKKN